jgi:hypothetical protein
VVVPTFVLFSFIFVVISLVNLGITPYFIRHHYRLLSRGCANPLKIDPAMRRIRLIVTIVLSVTLWCVVFLEDEYLFPNFTVCILGLWSLAYFRSCDPLPPGSAKER